MLKMRKKAPIVKIKTVTMQILRCLIFFQGLVRIREKFHWRKKFINAKEQQN